MKITDLHCAQKLKTYWSEVQKDGALALKCPYVKVQQVF